MIFGGKMSLLGELTGLSSDNREDSVFGNIRSSSYHLVISIINS